MRSEILVCGFAARLVAKNTHFVKKNRQNIRVRHPKRFGHFKKLWDKRIQLCFIFRKNTSFKVCFQNFRPQIIFTSALDQRIEKLSDFDSTSKLTLVSSTKIIIWHETLQINRMNNLETNCVIFMSNYCLHGYQYWICWKCRVSRYWLVSSTKIIFWHETLQICRRYHL